MFGLGKKRIVYVLGSGAAYGYAHIGVLKHLEELSLTPSAIVGTSMGAVLGSMYAAGLRTKDILRIIGNLDILKLTNLFWPSFPHGGIIKSDHVRNFLTEILGDHRIEDLPIPFVCVATDIVTGEEVIFSEGPLVEAVVASLSMPAIFAPVAVGGRMLVDGGITNPLPMDVARKLGNYSIAVNVLPRVTPKERRRLRRERLAELDDIFSDRRERIALKSIDAITKGIADLTRRHGGPPQTKPNAIRSILTARRSSPGIFDVISNMIWIFSKELIRPKRSWGRYTLIEPDVRDFNMFDFTKAKEMIAIGYNAAKPHSSKLSRLAR
ncbi:MAG: patatin-like phospholipase family protein [Spirochaetota bacterium]